MLILADEPTGNLDSKNGKDVISLLKVLNKENKTAIIQVTHNMEVAKMSDEIMRLKDGELLE